MSFLYLYPPLEIYQELSVDQVKELNLTNHCDFNTQQKEVLAELKRALNQGNIFPSQESLQRFFKQNSFHKKNTIDSLIKAEKFFQTFQIFALSKESQDIIHRGGIYLFGRDKNFVPNLYIITEKLKNYQENMSSIKNALIYISIIIIENMLLPNMVEKFNIIIESYEGEDKLFFFHTLFVQITEIFTEIFPQRLFSFKVIDKKFQELKDYSEIIKGTSTEVTFFENTLQSDYIKNLQKNETELKFAGDCFDLQTFWPPKSPFSDNEILITKKTLQKKGNQMFKVIDDHKKLGMVQDQMEQSLFNNSIHNQKLSCIEEEFKPCSTSKKNKTILNAIQEEGRDQDDQHSSECQSEKDKVLQNSFNNFLFNHQETEEILGNQNEQQIMKYQVEMNDEDPMIQNALQIKLKKMIQQSKKTENRELTPKCTMNYRINMENNYKNIQ